MFACKRCRSNLVTVDVTAVSTPPLPAGLYAFHGEQDGVRGHVKFHCVNSLDAK